MPSGFGGMGRGSDTRMYAPRSESSRMYASDDEDSYRHGAGDAEEQERRRDEKMRKREETKTVGDTPHLQIAIDRPEQDPMMGGMEEPQQEEDPNMYNPEQDAMASDMSAMAGALGTGGPDLSQALGAQTNGVMGGYRPLVATGEPMDDAWSTLMKEQTIDICNECGQPYDSIRGALSRCSACTQNRLAQSFHAEGDYEMAQHFAARPEHSDPNWQDTIEAGEPMADAWSTLMKSSLKNIKPKKNKPWQQHQFDPPPGGRRPDLATSLRSSRQARTLSPRTEHGGTTEAPLAVEMGHLALTNKQPLRMFPGKYRQQLGQRQQHSLMGNITMPYQTHNIEQRTPTKPGPMGAGKIIGMPTGKGRSKGVAKSELQEMNTLLKSAKDYLHISQLRRMIRDLKKIVERQDRMKKAPLSRGSNKNKESNHRGETTNPQGGTDDPKSDEMSSSGSPGHVFAARGSGRVA